jgi:hypothetical protein
MPDSRAPRPAPRDWGDALAALPLETPPSDGWSTLASRLPPTGTVPASRQHPLRRVAMVAALMVVVLLPAWQFTRPAPSATPGVVERQASARPAAVPTPIYGEALPQVLPSEEMPRPAAETVAAIDGDIGAAPPRDRDRAAAGHTPVVAATRRAEPSRPDRLDALYAESAQLEAVLAQLPESQVANAATEALSAGLQDRVASIDAALSQPVVPPDTQADLWQQRVDTLRQLTGVATTQRWQVARGELPHTDPSIY